MLLELDSLVDGVTAVAYGTPESAAAMRAASEGTGGVRDVDGGLGGGGAGAASLAVGEQLQNMVLVVPGGPWGMGCERRGAAQRWVQARGVVRGEKLFMYVRSLEGQWCGQTGRKSRGDFEVLVCYMTLAGAAAPHRVFALERSARHQPALPYTLCDTLKTSYRRAGLGGSRKPCQSLRRAF